MRFRGPAILAKLLPLIAVLTGIGVGASIPEYSVFIAQLGAQFSEPDMATDYVIGIIWAALIGISIPFWPVPRSEKRDLSRLWLVRCVVTLGLMLYYEYHYPLDACYYYHECKFSTYDWSLVGIGKGVEFITGLLWLMDKGLPVYHSYHALKVICSLIGFLGVYLFYRGCVLYSGQRQRSLLYVLMLCPSILFWSSILGKDPIHWFGIACYIYGVFGFARTRRVVYLLPMVLGLWVNIMIRVWSAFIFLTPFAIVGIWRVRNIAVKLLLIIVVAAGARFSLDQFSRSFSATSVESVVQSTNSLSKSWNRGGSANTAPEFNSLGGMIAFAPVGMFTALFRPLPGDVLNLFGVIASLENLIILSLMLWAAKRGAMRALRDEMALWSVCLLLIWSFFYGFISYQNLGAAVRFRLQVEPVLLTLALYMASASRAKRRYGAATVIDTLEPARPLP